MNVNRVLAVALLAGTIIGAGIFSLPYLVNRVGLVAGFFYLLFFGGVYYAVHTMYADLLRQTETSHQFSFLTRQFLPRRISGFFGGVVFLELIFVLVVYLILAPSFLTLVLGYSTPVLVLLFWAIGSLFLFARLSWIGWAEFSGVVAILGILAAIAWKGWGNDFSASVSIPFEAAGFLLLSGPLLFSLSGRPAIAKVVEEWRKGNGINRPFSLSGAIAAGTMIPVVLYALFVIGILILSPAPSEDAISGLGFLSPAFSVLFGCLGFLTLWTSYGMIAVNIRDTLRDDMKVGRIIAYAAPVFIPAALYFLGVNKFLGVISFTGSVFLGLEGIAITWMWLRAFPVHPRRWVAVPVLAVFCAALVSEVVKYL